MDVIDALKRRISTRAFLDTPVSEEQVRELLDAARWSASGGNLQPWQVHVVAGEARQRVIDAVQKKLSTDPFTNEAAFPVYPESLWEPYRSRRFQVGEDMYELLGVPREDKGARLAHLMANYEFFGAPVGVFFSIDERMNPNQWAHLGMFMMSFCLAAESRGLATCMQEAWTVHCGTVAKALGIEKPQIVYCGLALGHADKSAKVNQLRSRRAEVDEFASFEGF
ncbi:NADH dehydrogenase [Glycocaulis albus]|uniref:NADH dehydrogenase n=1 Tax=Glycocaulis albus TaxID=1382801 RepID=A0ABQ1Y0I0_9PROT|nr:nitroreductase [Glycocaulis albus]MBV5258013.1 nitroreductase [Synechococcus moorigangaii CMS01]GGH08556.1 NADH dehydrogenase [Glycocaulis albus]